MNDFLEGTTGVHKKGPTAALEDFSLKQTNMLTLSQTKNLDTSKLKDLQSTISNSMIMAESSPNG